MPRDWPTAEDGAEEERAGGARKDGRRRARQDDDEPAELELEAAALRKLEKRKDIASIDA
jgi:hypothetical protein